jgi:hypothetical protein
VAELRALPAWPPGDWVLDVPVDGDQRYNVVRVFHTKDSGDAVYCRAARVAANIAEMVRQRTVGGGSC